jgi:hypothetical protein
MLSTTRLGASLGEAIGLSAREVLGATTRARCQALSGFVVNRPSLDVLRD